jgi:hypothetical protein
MSEPDPYRSLYPDQPHIKRLHTVAGEQVKGTNRENALGGNIEQAVFSTAPYTGRGKLCMANKDTCNGKRAKGTEYCVGHLRSFGMLKDDQRAARNPKDPG